ncbi:MAG: hypothetical protein CL808_03045 [Citromicrobium sp.]|nr:hypothetical protein [Citromicrobium sp.]
MNDLTRDSDRLISEARRLRDDNRSGGRHRMVRSIGKGSAEAKLKLWAKRGGMFAGAVVAILIAMSIAGAVLGGIGFWGLVVAFFAALGAAALFANYPRLSVPQAGDLNKGTPRQMIARTELWLEAQRPALPAPAVALVDDLGVKLDLLGKQLETAPASHDSIRDIRELVGETLPEMVQSYTRVPAAMRREEHAGATADDRLVEGLGKISGEIDSINRTIADGALDDLAVQHRYLGYRYGNGAASGGSTQESAPN